MALQKDLVFNGHLNNFIKIKEVKLDYFQQNITVLYWVFKNRTTFLQNKYDFAKEFRATFSKDDVNLTHVLNFVKEIERVSKIERLDDNLNDMNLLTNAIDSED